MIKVNKRKATLSEHQEQCLIIKWASFSKVKHPCLEFLFSTLNGVKLTMGQARKAKVSGNKSGVPDLILPYPSNGFHGLYIELKVGYNKPSPNQKKYIKFLNKVGYRAEVAYGSNEAINIIEDYLLNKEQL